MVQYKLMKPSLVEAWKAFAAMVRLTRRAVRETGASEPGAPPRAASSPPRTLVRGRARARVRTDADARVHNPPSPHLAPAPTRARAHAPARTCALSHTSSPAPHSSQRLRRTTRPTLARTSRSLAGTRRQRSWLHTHTHARERTRTACPSQQPRLHSRACAARLTGPFPTTPSALRGLFSAPGAPCP